MSDPRFQRLEDVILDEAFPEVDLALRRGRHIDRDDAELFAFLVDAEDHLEPFYRRFGCDLVRKADGYFYLLPTNDRLGKRHLSPAEMLVGQGLALLFLDPATVERGGLVTREEVLAHLAGAVGTDALVKALNPKRRRYDERVAAETVRTRVADGIRRLAGLGFVELVDEGHVRLRAALLRFAEPLRGAGSEAARLAALVEAGEIVLPEENGSDGDEDPDADDAADDDGAAEEAGAPDDAPSLEAPPHDDAPAPSLEAPPDDDAAAPSLDAPPDDDAADEEPAP